MEKEIPGAEQREETPCTVPKELGVGMTVFIRLIIAFSPEGEPNYPDLLVHPTSSIPISLVVHPTTASMSR